MKYLTGTMAAMLFMFASSQSFAQQGMSSHEPYISVLGGVVMPTEAEVTDGVNVGTWEYNTGFAAGIAAGLNVASSVRSEVEYTYRRANIDNDSGLLNGVPEPIDGTASSHALMANVWWEPEMQSPVQPYVGGGIGAAIDVFKDHLNGGTDDGIAFAWQAGAGLAYPLSSRITTFVDYRYMSTVGGKFDDVDYDFASHNVMFGFRAAL